jgi:hypothetical protein
MNIKQMFQTALKHQNQPGLPGAVVPLMDEENGCPGPACSQAGGSPQATGLVPLDWVILSNPRAEREFDFLVQTVGEEKIHDVRALLGARKAYPLNLARVLGVKLPEELATMPTEQLKEKIQDLRRRLVSAGGGAGVQREGRGAGLAPDPTPHSGVPGTGDDHA